MQRFLVVVHLHEEMVMRVVMVTVIMAMMVTQAVRREDIIEVVLLMMDITVLLLLEVHHHRELGKLKAITQQEALTQSILQARAQIVKKHILLKSVGFPIQNIQTTLPEQVLSLNQALLIDIQLPKSMRPQKQIMLKLHRAPLHPEAI